MSSILRNLNVFEGEIEKAEDLCADIADAFNKNYDDIEEAIISHVMGEGIDFNNFTNIINDSLMEETKQELLQLLEENGILAECVDIQHEANGMCLYFSINNENVNSGSEARRVLNDVAFEYRDEDKEVEAVINECESFLDEIGYEDPEWLKEDVKSQIDNEFDFWEYDIAMLKDTYLRQTISLAEDTLQQTLTLSCNDDHLLVNGKQYIPDTNMVHMEKTNNKYDYKQEITNDIREWVFDNINLDEYAGNRNALEEYLSEKIVEDVTGIDERMYCEPQEAKQHLEGNENLLNDALIQYGEIADTPEFNDALIRLYLLDDCISHAIDQIEAAFGKTLDEAAPEYFTGSVSWLITDENNNDMIKESFEAIHKIFNDAHMDKFPSGSTCLVIPKMIPSEREQIVDILEENHVKFFESGMNYHNYQEFSHEENLSKKENRQHEKNDDSRNDR